MLDLVKTSTHEGTPVAKPFSAEEISPVTVTTTKPSKEERKELAMQKAGVSDALMMDVMYRGLNAKKVSRELRDGVWEERIEDDLIIQHKYLDSALRVAGFIKNETNVDNSVNFNLTIKQREEIRARLGRVFGGKIGADGYQPPRN